MSDAAPLASVVIPTLNAGREFEETLAAIRGQRDVGAIDLVILDSESGDATVELARRFGAHVRMVRRATFDHGATRNLGAALARGRFVGFLTQDALPANELWLRALIDALERENAVGAYSRVLPRPGCSPLVERSVRFDLVYATQRQVKRTTPERLAAMEQLERRCFAHFNNVASCVRRDFFARRPFPEIAFGEDLAWGDRVLAMGETLVYEPDSVVIHSHESDLRLDHARHRIDSRVMKALFRLRVREGWSDGLAAWREELRRDAAFLAGTPLPWHEKLAARLYGLVLRAVQVAGQVAGTRSPLPVPIRWPEHLPNVERRDHGPEEGQEGSAAKVA